MRTRILTAILFVVAACPAPAQIAPTLASLIPAADAIVVAEISDTDYSRTAADGPMTARVKVLNSLKGVLRKDQSFSFTETAWVGPNYKTGEVRILFLESSPPNAWRILSHIHAKGDFFVDRDAITLLSLSSLKAVLEKLPPARRILITKDMLRASTGSDKV